MFVDGLEMVMKMYTYENFVLDVTERGVACRVVEWVEGGTQMIWR